MLERVTSKAEVRAAVAEARREGRRIGFVPTMGALHAGHMELVRAACARTDFVVVSIFVNPTQFGPNEDFAAYPRPIERDIELLSAEGVSLAFTPTPEVMYTPGPSASVNPGPLAERWEGEVRPGHFEGVATVVTKLLNVVRPDLAFFGEKDFQQLAIVNRVVQDLDLGVGIVCVPIVREPDGLALSSRNAYLDDEQRAAALGLSEALEQASRALAWGERDAAELQRVMREAAESRGVALDYAAVVDPESLEPLAALDAPARALIAGRVGATRLIDNCPLVPPAEAAE